MPELPITTLSAALLTFLYVFLALKVINLRRTGAGPSIGTDGDDRFVRAVRAHGNLGEYAPLFLILLGLYELQTESVYVSLVCSGLFIIGRIIHAVGFGFLGKGPWRVLGMIGTNSALLILAISNLLLTL